MLATSPLDLYRASFDDDKEKHNQLLENIVHRLEQHPLRGLGGFEKLEDHTAEVIDRLPVGEGTIFALICDEAHKMGLITDGTVGGAMEALGFNRRSKKAKEVAHEIGCYCHTRSAYISPTAAAQRIRHLKT